MMQINTKIRQLSDITVSRIAAGEVIEKPASVVKELVENSIDAGATKIDIVLESAGKNLIVVSDNGCGMSRDDLALSVHRHTTSKLNENDIMDIKNFGFRGEALPSIGSVSRMTISTYDASSGNSWQIYVEGGNIGDVVPYSHMAGTQIEVRDLFFATPARLKFLRSERSELSASIDIVKKIAMSHPDIAFSLTSDGKNILKLKASDIDKRITEILGADFIENSTAATIDHPEMRLSGRVSLPTYNRAAAVDQFLFINNRPVKDKILATAVKVAYQDFLARDRHPILVLFLDVDPHLVDVNVHPAKSEVRFHDPNMIRGLLISSIKNSIESGSHKVSTTNAQSAIASFSFQPSSSSLAPSDFVARDSAISNFKPIQPPSYKNPKTTSEKINFMMSAPMSRVESYTEEFKQSPETKDYPLGAACAQLHKTYIISQTEDSVIITDQHAAH
ncbi:MAG: DNA mismatch repair endonuclease MutL, partial [Rickettsiaceae bacterium]|nr:DNA mismatch repair endonuclease MutL [Rickettsiaceae bacterium]